jgi:acetyltransferase-like isoleucine patch superfamily enzyme
MLIRWLNKIISRAKGHNYEIDKDIPAGYLISLLLTRGCMLANGKLSGIKNKGLLFVSLKCTIKARSKITVGRSVSFERGCYVDALSKGGLTLGNNVSVGKNTKIEGTGNLQFLGKGMIVGDSVGLGSDSFYGCAGGIEVGDFTIIGNFVSFHSENHVFSDPEVPIKLQGVTHQGITVGKGCWIGAKSTILDGAHIGDGCIIAAGAVVKAGIYQNNGIYGGVPAKLLKTR